MQHTKCYVIEKKLEEKKFCSIEAIPLHWKLTLMWTMLD